MDFKIDYTRYSNEELRDALAHIDKDKYPERAKEKRSTIQVKRAEKIKKEKYHAEMGNLVIVVFLIFTGLFALITGYFDWYDGVSTGRNGTLLRADDYEKFDSLIRLRVLVGFACLSGAAYKILNKSGLLHNKSSKCDR
ncbi:hypothetical protein [Thalassomonas sp. RHCl1]|uniref:hypothetical protein n=1 Tax=Thalassomonas sp. RHCl1 TaxID=2995320 RepID=UPI00248B6ED3|nr:hypothetical protein [Thalassomonas sp. RHCl1]